MTPFGVILNKKKKKLRLRFQSMISVHFFNMSFLFIFFCTISLQNRAHSSQHSNRYAKKWILDSKQHFVSSMSAQKSVFYLRYWFTVSFLQSLALRYTTASGFAKQIYALSCKFQLSITSLLYIRNKWNFQHLFLFVVSVFVASISSMSLQNTDIYKIAQFSLETNVPLIKSLTSFCASSVLVAWTWQY